VWYHADIAFTSETLSVRRGATFQANPADVDGIPHVHRVDAPPVQAPDVPFDVDDSDLVALATGGVSSTDESVPDGVDPGSTATND